MLLYEVSVPQLKKMLSHLDAWLEAAVEHAQKKAFDPKVLLTARLAPDQYPLYRQVQAACDAAKFAAARAGGKDAPRHEDNEVPLEELRARIRSVIDYLASFTPADFEGAEKREVKLAFWDNKSILVPDYLTELALPNFYFHVTHAYAILRHNGVNLGKADYIGSAKVF